jgi:hypothetical protein
MHGAFSSRKPKRSAAAPANPSHSRQAQSKRARVGGIAAEEIAANALRFYGLGEVQRIPLDWKHTWRGGKVVGGTPARKQGVDIHAIGPGGVAVRCEVKWTSDPSHGLSWGELTPDQRARLDETRRRRGMALVAWVMPGQTFVIPWGSGSAWCDGQPLHVEAARALHDALTASWPR